MVTLIDVTNGTVTSDMGDANTNFTTITAYLNEIIAARVGESTLLAKQQAQDALIDALSVSNGPLAEYLAGRFIMGEGMDASTTATELTIFTKPDWSRQALSFTAVSNKKYTVIPGADPTLPVAPSDEDQIWFSPLGDMVTTNSTIGRNGKTIMGLAENMDWNANVGFSLVYDSTLGDWRFAT